jgi:hypothetical protein
MATKTARQTLFEWFDSLPKAEQRSLIEALYGSNDPRLEEELAKGTYLGPSPRQGFEKRGYYLGPAPQHQSMSARCPTCHRPY